MPVLMHAKDHASVFRAKKPINFKKGETHFLPNRTVFCRPTGLESQAPKLGNGPSTVLKPTGLWEEEHCGRQIAHTHCWYLKRVKFWFRCFAQVVSEFHRWFVAMSVRDPQGQTDGNCIRAECLTVLWELQCA